MSEEARELLPSIESVMLRVNAGFALNPKEAAVYLGEAPSTLAKKRLFGTGPRFYKGDGAAGAVRYDIPDLIAYKEARRRKSTADHPGLRPERLTRAAAQPSIAPSTAPRRREPKAKPKRNSTGGRRRR